MAEIFPNKQASLIFIAYISLFVSSGLLVTEAKRLGILGLNQIIIVLLTELLKLIICIVIYLTLKSGTSLRLLQEDLYRNRKLLLLYLVPAGLYCIYNNLTFINLQIFDPTTYFCLLQFRIVLTALIYQVLFKRKLTLAQWTSLAILTLGCLVMTLSTSDRTSSNIHQHPITNIGQHTTSHDHIEPPEMIEKKLGTTGDQQKTENTPTSRAEVGPNLEDAANIRNDNDNKKRGITYLITIFSLLLLQLFCSCFAGVYNEYLLKDSSSSKSADVILQNMFMYIDSIVCNIIVYMIVQIGTSNGTTTMTTTTQSLLSDSAVNQKHLAAKVHIGDHQSVGQILSTIFTQPLILIIILNNSLSGLVASLFLKNLNSVLKNFASAIELFAIAFLAWLIFDDQINLLTIVGLSLITWALYMYSKEPVSNIPVPTSSRQRSTNGFELLPEDDEEELILYTRQ